MQKTYFKVFFSKIKECEWLNKMGDSGYRLIKVSDSKYTFAHSDEHKYCYSVEYLENSPNSDVSVEYYESRIPEGIKPVLVSGNWVYFMREDQPIVCSSSVYKQNAKFYLPRVLYLYFFSLVGCLVNAYQFYSIGYLDKIGHLSDEIVINPQEIEDAKNIFGKILNAAKGLLNKLIDLANDYFNLWFKAFGVNDAVAVISIVLPITLVVLIIASLNLDEYLKHRKLSKPQTAVNTSSVSETEVTNAE